eukprot:1225780-Heterocapsa_arctica.AAC.1
MRSQYIWKEKEIVPMSQPEKFGGLGASATITPAVAIWEDLPNTYGPVMGMLVKSSAKAAEKTAAAR